MTNTPVTYAEFCDDLLEGWSSDAVLAPDATVVTAMDAAKVALYRVAVSKEGTVLVVAPAGEQRAIVGFLDAMSEGHEVLATFRGRIEVTVPERAALVRDAVATIELTDGPVAGRDMDDSEATRRVAHILIAAMHGQHVGEALLILGNLYPDEPAQSVLDHLIATQGERDEARKEEREREWRQAQVDPSGNLPKDAYRQTEQPILSRDDQITSAQFEEKRARDLGLSEMRNGPRQKGAITTKHPEGR